MQNIIQMGNLAVGIGVAVAMVSAAYYAYLSSHSLIYLRPERIKNVTIDGAKAVVTVEGAKAEVAVEGAKAEIKKMTDELIAELKKFTESLTEKVGSR